MNFKFKPGNVSHLGIAVKDLDAFMELCSKAWGVGPWQIDEYTEEINKLVGGEPFKVRMGLVKFGPIMIEAIETIEGKSPWSVEDYGEGFHHISFASSNYDEVVKQSIDNGFEIEFGGVFEGRRWVSFKPVIGNLRIEVEEDFYS